MELLTPYEIMYLSDRNCPVCNGEIEYDENYLHCVCCHKAWNYGFYKSCKNEYELNPQEYLKNIGSKYLP